MILGLLAASATVVSWTAGTFVFLEAARRIQPALLNRARLLLAAAATALLAMVIHGMWPTTLLSGPSADSWLWLGLSGLVGLTIGDYFGFSALRILGARRQSVISSVAPAATAVGAWLLLDEQLTAATLAGMALAIGGVMVAMSGATERSDVNRDGFGSFGKGVLMAVIAAACQGLGVVLAKRGLANVAPLHATFMRMSTAFVLAYALDLFRGARILPLRQAFVDPTGRKAMMLGALFGPVIGVTMSLVAVRHLDSAVAQTLFSMVPLLVMTVAAVRSHEHIPRRAIIGAVIATAGVVVMLR
jgi:drug/metabolite transporter (DMT)-like permease